MLLAAGANTLLSGTTLEVRSGGGFDLSALVVSEDGKVSGDADMVFYNQPATLGIGLHGDRMWIDLDHLRPGAVKVVLVASPETGRHLPGTCMIQVGPHTTAELGRTDLAAAVLAEVYQHKGAWKVRAVLAGWASGLAGLATDYGVDVDPEPEPLPAPTPTPAPATVPRQHVPTPAPAAPLPAPAPATPPTPAPAPVGPSFGENLRSLKTTGVKLGRALGWVPTIGNGIPSQRFGRRPQLPPAQGRFDLQYNPDGTVVRFDPDLPIDVYVDDRQAAKPEAYEDVETALHILAEASGLRFRLKGRVKFIPSQKQQCLENRSGPTLVVSWAPPHGRRSSNLLDRGGQDDAGIGGWQTRGTKEGNKPWRYTIVAGFVVMDSTNEETRNPGFGANSRGEVLLHELMHALGLGHVNDPRELMYPEVRDRPAVLGPGDRSGLQRVGSYAGPI